MLLDVRIITPCDAPKTEDRRFLDIPIVVHVYVSSQFFHLSP